MAERERRRYLKPRKSAQSPRWNCFAEDEKKKRKKERRKTASLVASWRVQWKDRIAELGTNRLLAYAQCIVEKGWYEGGRVFYYLMERGTIDLVHGYTQRWCSKFCEKSRNLIVLRLLLFCVIKSLDVILEKKDMILVKKKKKWRSNRKVGSFNWKYHLNQLYINIISIRCSIFFIKWNFERNFVRTLYRLSKLIYYEINKKYGSTIIHRWR